MELELSFTHSPVSEVTVRRFGAKVSDEGRIRQNQLYSAKVFCWLSTTPQILTLPVDVGCVALYEFWERENSLEKRVRCRKARKCECERDVVHSHTASAHTLPQIRPLPFFAFPHLSFFSREISLSQKS